MYPAFDGSPIGVGVGFEEAVQLAAHFGFEGIYLDVAYLAENGPETVVYMLEERNLKAAGWGLPMRPLGGAEEFTVNLERLAATAALCARASAYRCSTWLAPASDDMPFDEHFALMAERLTAIARVLGAEGVRLGLEFVGPPSSRSGRRHEFVHDLPGMLELIDAVDADNVGLLLDCWHLFTSGGSMDDVLTLTDEQIVNVHVNDAPADVPVPELKDNVRCLPGETGRLHGRRFMECLQQIGYCGPVMAEPFSQALKLMDQDEAIRTVKAAIDSIWPD